MTPSSPDPLWPPVPPREVDQSPCQSICVWAVTGETWKGDAGPDLRVFACRGCGSEWVRTEPWTPIDAAGEVPGEIRAERARGASGAATTCRGVGAADSADTCTTSGS